MLRRAEWKRLLQAVRQYGSRVNVIPDTQFYDSYPSDVYAVFDPRRRRIIIPISSTKDEDALLFRVAHELGHMIDHTSEPELSAEYGFYYIIASVYNEWEKPVPDDIRRVFLEREEMANEIGLSVLRDCQITVSDESVVHPH